jgi:hypothetical protein
MAITRSGDGMSTIELSLSTHPSIFVGKKPVAVLFGNEREPTHTWSRVYKAILQRAIQEPIYYERLMELRNRMAGKVRVFISDKPDNMTRPLEICEGLYGEVHYGSQTLMHILVNIILKAIHYDCSDIKIEIHI